MNGSNARSFPVWAMAAVLGAIGAAVWAAGWMLDSPSRVLGAWLAAFVFWLGLPLGALGIIMIHDVTGGRWGDALRHPLELLAAALPIFVLVAAPVLGGMRAIYPWAIADRSAGSTAPTNDWYLDPTFFALRMVAYFTIWIVLERVLRRPPGDPRRARVGAVGLILFALTVTFASFDWVSSLDPGFSSSAYGMMVGTGTLTSALAASILIATLRPADPHTLAACGNLLLTGILVWAYIAFMQFLIVWEENLSDEIPWYVRRLGHGWNIAALAIVLGHFALPSVLLLSRRLKSSRSGLASVCILVLAAHLLDVWWLVLPDIAPGGLGWGALAATVAVGGGAAAFGFWRESRGPPAGLLTASTAHG